MVETLLELGLSRHAATIYIALLEIGRTTITKVVEQTGLHPQIIYNAIEELEALELTSHTIERGRKYFQPGPPSTLVALQQSRLAKVEDILPKLLAKYQKSEQSQVWVFSGDEEFRKAREKVVRSIPRGECYYVIGSGGKKFLQAMEGTFRASEQARIKRGVHKRVIDFNDHNEYEDPIGGDNLSQYRYLDSEAGPTSTLFGGEYLRINVWSTPVLTILIKNRDLVESYKHYFETLWSVAK